MIDSPQRQYTCAVICGFTTFSNMVSHRLDLMSSTRVFTYISTDKAAAYSRTVPTTYLLRFCVYRAGNAACIC